ncbi:MAG: hypothetical protein JXB49_05700 [Bacteroidales bacterium]|nr:hypothetical protein [Bacteroidales bacterium]
MNLSEAKKIIESSEKELENSLFVIAYTFIRDEKKLHLAITERLKQKSRKGRIWKSKAFFTAFKNAKYGYDVNQASSKGGKDGIYLLTRDHVPANEMMNKIFDRFLDKPDQLAIQIADYLKVELDELQAVRIVSHHLRLLGVLKHEDKQDTIILVDYDDAK